MPEFTRCVWFLPVTCPSLPLSISMVLAGLLLLTLTCTHPGPGPQLVVILGNSRSLSSLHASLDAHQFLTFDPWPVLVMSWLSSYQLPALPTGACWAPPPLAFDPWRGDYLNANAEALPVPPPPQFGRSLLTYCIAGQGGLLHPLALAQGGHRLCSGDHEGVTARPFPFFCTSCSCWLVGLQVGWPWSPLRPRGGQPSCPGRTFTLVG